MAKMNLIDVKSFVEFLEAPEIKAVDPKVMFFSKETCDMFAMMDTEEYRRLRMIRPILSPKEVFSRMIESKSLILAKNVK